MWKPWLLRLHRWITLVFAAPLGAVIVTGLILSFEPIVQVTAVKPGALSAESLGALIARHDPHGQARSLSIRVYENRATIGGVGPDGSIDVDLATGAETADEPFLSWLFYAARGWHEELIFEMGWLVQASTFAMLILIALGLLMGWPRIRNTLGGWHQAMAWGLLPLVVLSPLTGLALAYGVTFLPAGPRLAAPPLPRALVLLGERHDLSGLVWMRPRGGQMSARIIVDGDFRSYRIGAEGAVANAVNWPRAIHEGNFAGVWSGAMNVVLSVAFIGMMATGLILWAKRRFRRRTRARAPVAVAAE